MIVIGIDPGTATTGYGIIELKEGNMICLDYGIIKTDKSLSSSFRLDILNKEISNMIKKYNPDALSIEKVYFLKNLKTAFPVSEAKGVIIMTASRENIPVHEFTPPQIKLAVTGYGKADKSQVQKMIRLTLNLEEIPQPDDAADALGAAICGINILKQPF